MLHTFQQADVLHEMRMLHCAAAF